MNLLTYLNTKNKIDKDAKGENMPHLKITEVVLVYCNILYNDYQHDSTILYTFVSNKSFGQLLIIFHLKMLYFEKALIENFYILKYGLLI